MMHGERIDFLGKNPLDLAKGLDALAADIRALAAGVTPGLVQLRAAPMLRTWSFAERQQLCLTGHVYGHPIITDGRSACTSEIIAIDPARRWARTFSRLYELGPAAMSGLDS